MKTFQKPKIKYPLAVGFIGMLLASGLYWIFGIEEVEAEWFDDQWYYRKAITITNNGSTQTNFQVKVLSDYDMSTEVSSGKVQADFDDLRFTDNRGKLLPYWIEDSTSSSLDVWVKIDFIPAGESVIYMYYGNPNAASYQNGEDVFEFFDDFNDQSIEGWIILNRGNWHGQLGDWNATNGYLSSGGDGASIRTTNQVVPSGGKEFKFRFIEREGCCGTSYYGSNGIGARIIWVDENNYIESRLYTSPDTSNPETYNNAKISERASGSLNHLATSTDYDFRGDCQSGKWFWVRIRKEDNQGKWKIWRDDEPEPANWNWEGTFNASAPDQGYFQVKIFWSGPSNQGSIDDIYISKYSSNIVVGTPASEEKGPGPVAYWRFDEGYDSTTYDDSPNNNDGSISGATWQTEDFCINGKCLWFDGANDKVEISVLAGNPLNFGDGDFTMGGWFRITQPSDKGCSILGNYPHAANLGDLVFGISDTVSRIFFAHRNTADQSWSATYDFTDYFGKWTHIEWVKSGNTLKLYLNGINVQNWNITITFDVDYYGDKFWVGRGDWCPAPSYGTPAPMFADDIRIYNYARTAEQIKADYLARLTGGSAASATFGRKDQGWISDGLVGYWKMDESSWNGTTGEVKDSSGAGNDGTAKNGANTTSTAKFGMAGGFDGTDDYVAVPDSASLPDDNNQVTLAAWVYPTAIQGKLRTFIIRYGTYPWFLRIWNEAEPARFEFDIYDTTERNVFSSNIAYSNRWYHVVGTYDGSVSRIYVNGKLEGEQLFNVQIRSSNSPLYIGKWPGQEFDGVIDSVRIYNRALSPQEVRWLYEWAPGPVGYWKMDEKSGTTAYDSSGNENTGTLINGPTWANGKFGGAVEILEKNDVIEISDIGGSNITATMWYYFEDTGGSWNTLFCRDGGTHHHLLINGSSHEIGFYNSGWYSSGYTLTTGQWYHLALVKTGTNSKIYVNGVLKQDSNSSFDNNDYPLSRIGNYGGNSQGSLGKIDDVRIYNYARTQKQIIEDMNAGHPAVGSPVGSYVGYWKFDEGYGSTAYDDSINNNDGTINGATWTNEGKFGKALAFDGVDDYVDVPNSPELNPTSAITVEAWIYPAMGFPASRHYLVTSKGVYNVMDFRIASGGSTLRYQHEIGGVNKSVAYELPANLRWYHAVTTYDGSELRLYVDGILRDSTPATSTLKTIDAPITIGAYFTRNKEWWKGIIDEVKIYPFALTADEIKAEYNRGAAALLGAVSTESDGSTPSYSSARSYCIPGDTSTCDPPVAEWKFDEKTGDYAYDTSGNGNKGTLTNMESEDWKSAGQCKKGSCLEFDGVNEYIITEALMSSPSTETLSLWIYPQSSGVIVSELGQQTINSGYHYIKIGLNTNNELKGNIWNCNNDLSFGTINLNQWYFVTLVYDGSAEKAYLNGQLKDTYTCSRSAPSTQYLAFAATDGQTAGGFDDTGYFEGRIDDIKLYDYARTPAQIAWDYNRGKPVAHWRFDECQGTTAYDDSDNDNDGDINIGGSGNQTSAGTCESGDSADAWYNGRNGKYNSALSFDGTDDYVDVGGSYSITGDRTITAWVKPNTNTGYGLPIITGGTAGAGDFWGIAGTSGSCTVGQYELYIDHWGTPCYDSNIAVTINTWNHVAFVFDDTNSKIYFYVNGVAGSIISNVLYDYNINTYDIGGNNIGGSTTKTSFNGLIDDVRIYNYALTEQQIKMDYNQGAAIRFGD